MVAQEKPIEQIEIARKPQDNPKDIVPPIQLRHFTVADYYRMGEIGILSEDDHVELIKGDVLEMPPIDSPHSGKVNRITVLLTRLLGDKSIIAVQNPILISDDSSPQPDFAVLHPRADFYEDKHPTPTDVYLVIEVSDSTLRFDKIEKAMLYAQAGIPEYWILDVNNKLVIQHTQPSETGYQLIQQLTAGKTVASPTLPDLSLGVDQIFGK